MHSSFHAASGVLAGEATLMLLDKVAPDISHNMGLTIGFGVAFISHHFIDKLGESRIYSSFNKAIIIDAIFITGILFLLLYPVFGLSALLFMIGGTGMDLIDKGRNFIYKWKGLPSPHPKLFPCHNMRPPIRLTKGQTKFWNAVSWVTVLAFAFISAKFNLAV